MKRIAIIICAIFCVKHIYSSENVNQIAALKTNSHEIRLAYSDAIPLTVANFLGTGIGDAITNTNRTNAESWGLFEIGYRYYLKKWKIGGDFGFGYMSSDLISKDNATTPVTHQHDLNFLIMPAGELSYYQKKYVNLYGSASLGVMFTRTNYTSEKINNNTVGQPKMPERIIKGRSHLNNDHNNIADSDYFSKFYSTFAFQINPIGIRVGNNHIGGFLELGVGFKGFLTAGVSIQF